MVDPVKGIAGRLRQRCGHMADLTVEQEKSVPWHSLLFDGGRHHIALRLSGDHVEELISAIQDEIGAPDFIIPGHLVAQINVASIDRNPACALVRLDALTIESPMAPVR